jgi:hypothetical protein
MLKMMMLRMVRGCPGQDDDVESDEGQDADVEDDVEDDNAEED